MTDMAGWHTIDYAQRESQQRLPAYVLEETVSFLMQLHTYTQYTPTPILPLTLTR